MGIVIRQSSWSSALTIVGIILGYVNVLYLMPAYLTPSQYGLTRAVQDFAMLMVPFAQLGTSSTIIRYYPKFKDTADERSSFFSRILLIANVGFLIFMAFAFLLKNPLTNLFVERSPEVTGFFPLILALVWVMVTHNILSDFVRSNLEIVVPNFLKEVLLRFLTTLCILAYVLQWVSFEQFIMCIAGAYVLNMLILAMYLFQKTDLRFTIGAISSFSIAEYRPILIYGLFALLGTGGAVLIAKVDTLMVTSMLGTHETGIYAVAFYMAVLVEIPRRMVTQISAPLIARHLKSDNIAEVHDLYRKSSLNLAIVGGLIFIGLWANLDNIYPYIPNKSVYEAGKFVVIFIGLGKLLDMSFGLNGEIIVLSRYYKANIWLSVILALITIGLNAALIPIYGFTGAAMGTAISLALFNLMKYGFVRWRLKIHPFQLNHIKWLVLFLVVLVAALLTPRFTNPLVDLIIRSGLITVVYVGMVYGLRISEDINNAIRGVISKSPS